MLWKQYPHIGSAVDNELYPNQAATGGLETEDSGCSIPDVYGQAVQQYILLREADKQSDYDADVVRTWRGLIALLALRTPLRLPLDWERVTLREEMKIESNLFLDAVKSPLIQPDMTLFPDRKEWQWNGMDFFVLRWVPEGEEPQDLLLYSPLTLLYPVAGWRKRFQALTKRDVTMKRFFDIDGAGSFRSLVNEENPVLLETEPHMVRYWLEEMLKRLESQSRSGSLNGGDAPDGDVLRHAPDNGRYSDVRSAIRSHLYRFVQDLKKQGTRFVYHNFSFQPIPISGADAGDSQIPPPLDSSVRLAPQSEDGSEPGEPASFFSRQLCWFKVPAGNRNPFERCAFKDHYQIKGAPDGENWYAFLPIHPDYRQSCLSNGLAENVRMKYVEGDGRKRIHVTMTYRYPDNHTVDIPWEYELYTENPKDQKSGVTADYIAAPLSVKLLNVGNHSWPILAVWPNPIGRAWKKYYVMMDDTAVGDYTLKLRVADRRNVWEKSGDVLPQQDMALFSTNNYVVQTNYVPDAIPLIRLYNENGREVSVSVGIVTPETEPSTPTKRITAEVAVDFGTSSTRVYARVAGEDIQEVPVSEDEPVEVMLYKTVSKDGVQVGTGPSTNMSNLAKYFVTPAPPLPQEEKPSQKEKEEKSSQNEKEEKSSQKEKAKDGTLFSIYRRCVDRPLETVYPLLDGTIYQTGDEVKEPKKTDVNKLISNLKWNMQRTEDYYVAFMKQLLLHITAYLYRNEYVQQITWKYALPLSMNEKDAEAIQKIWVDDESGGENTLKGYLQSVCGGAVSHQFQKRYLSESVAASRFFLSQQDGQVNRGVGYLVVDIGGGSTDVALWRQKFGNEQPSLLWHDSIRIAGQLLFTRWLGESIEEISKGVNDPRLGNLLRKIEFADGTSRAGLIDQFLTTYEDRLMENYQSRCMNPGTPWAFKIRKKVSEGFTLMMFALGCQIGAFLACGLFTIPEEYKDNSLFTIAVGGRGSKILNWFLPGNEKNRNDILETFFHEGMLAGQVFSADEERSPTYGAQKYYKHPRRDSGQDSGLKKRSSQSSSPRRGNIRSREEMARKSDNASEIQSDRNDYDDYHRPQGGAKHLPASVHIFQSGKPKSEVAYGLLVESKTDETLDESWKAGAEQDAAIDNKNILYAANRFGELFQETFSGFHQENKAGKPKIRQMNESELGARIEEIRTPGRDWTQDKIFDVLMDVLYPYLSKD